MIVEELLSMSLSEGEIKDDLQVKPVSCPDCSNKVIRCNGILKGVQRYVFKKGRTSKQNIADVLEGKLDKAEVLCSDSHRSYTSFAKDKEISHKKFNASKGQR